MYSTQTMFYITLSVIALAQISLAAIGEQCNGNSCPNNEMDAYCDGGKCTCKRGEFVASSDKSKCLKVADSLGRGCEEDSQCTERLSFFAVCSSNYQCACKSDSSMVNNACEKKRLLGEKCTMKQQCDHIANSACTTTSLVCTCDNKYVPSSNATVCLPIAPTGQAACEESIQCSEGLGDSAICTDSQICGCKEGYHFNGDNFSGKCVLNKGISDTCSTGTRGDCYLPHDGAEQNIDCVDGLCKCKDGFIPTLENQSCNGAASVGVFSVVWLMIITVVTTTLG